MTTPPDTPAHRSDLAEAALAPRAGAARFLAVVAAVVAALLLAAPAAPALGAQDAQRGRAEGDGAFRCDQGTILTLAGVDTLAGEVLLRSPGGWLVTAEPSASDPGGGDWRETATYRREPAEPRVYGFSLGAGPVFGVHGCGDGCLQAVLWRDGAWEPLGGPLRGVPSGTTHGTYDTSGAPWLVVQSPLPPGEGPEDGVQARAWRLEEDAWISAGGGVARSSGAAAAVADPACADAVLSGTLRFRAGEPPEVWLAALPSLPASDVGVLVPVGPGAAYLTAEGRILLSRDGASWVRTRWIPWGQHATRLWRPGEDYRLDLPTADRRGPLHAVWLDRRPGSEGHLYLTSWEPGRDWATVADVPPRITTLDGAELDYSEIAVLGPDTWVLLTGCVNTANGPGLVLRTAGPDGLTRPRFLPLRPAR